MALNGAGQRLIAALGAACSGLPDPVEFETACALALLILRERADRTVLIGATPPAVLIAATLAHQHAEAGSALGIEIEDRDAGHRGPSPVFPLLRQLGLDAWVQVHALDRSAALDIAPETIDVLYLAPIPEQAQSARTVRLWVPRVKRPGGYVWLASATWDAMAPARQALIDDWHADAVLTLHPERGNAEPGGDTLYRLPYLEPGD